MTHTHSCLLEPVSVVPNHVLGENHSSRPCLPTTSRRQVFVELQRGGKEARQVECCIARGFVFGQRRDILPECQWRKLRRRRPALGRHGLEGATKVSAQMCGVLRVKKKKPESC